MKKESVISQVIRESNLSDVTSTLELVKSAITLFENILDSAKEYFEELDTFYDEITRLKAVGRAPATFNKMSDNYFRLLIMKKKSDAIRTRLSDDLELQDATTRINRFLKSDRTFINLGLRVSNGEMSANDVLYNYYKLIRLKEDLERRSNLYRR